MDPASEAPQRLTQDVELEYAAAIAYDSLGDLVAIYDRAQIAYETRFVTVGTDEVQIDDVPVPGDVDLYVLRHQRVGDLAVYTEGLSLSD